MRRILPVFIVAVLVACSSGSSMTSPGLSTTSSQGRATALPVTFIGDPLSLSIEGTEYWLGLDEGGCAHLVVLASGEYFAPLTNCAGALRSTEDCALRAPTSDNPDLMPPCEVPIPAVVVGRFVSERHDLVACFLSFGNPTSVSFTTLSEDGLYLEALAEPYAVYLYIADGRRLSEPVSADDPDNLAMCDDAGPWNTDG